ncbi:MAG: plasmid pRiA4b ORF-3 family protein [Candidatus Delongbacteria bacterium]|nr:plasmid pRiA4b ORF-3 family protein [Candidatus Delongbacteria bacterium]
MGKTAYQIKITLKDSDPKIWRRIIISSGLLLPDLHKVIQTSMGWTNSHLHQFIKGKKYYLDEYDEMESAFGDRCIVYNKVKISDVLIKEKEKFEYEYDFGDGWRHEILLEKILQADKKFNYPVCIEGKMSCPPDDCGGIGGYYDMLDIIRDPKNKEYEETIDWLGGDFDPEYFNIDEV